MHLDILVSAGAGVTEDGAVHRNMTVSPSLTPCSDHPQGPGGHAVDRPVGVPVLVTDGDGEPPVVGSDDVEVEPGPTGDVQSALLAGIVGFIQVRVQRLWDREQ